METGNAKNNDGNGVFIGIILVALIGSLAVTCSIAIGVNSYFKVKEQQRQIDQLCVATTILVFNNSAQTCAFTNLQQGQYTMYLPNYGDNSAVCLYDNGATNYYIHVYDIPNNYLRRWKQGVNRLFLCFPNKPNN